MGACSSNIPKVDDVKSKKRANGADEFLSPPFVKIINPRNSRINLDESQLKQLHITGKHYEYDINYCYVSQKGYYPNALGKANQDSYVIYENMLGDSSCHVFGVFDGHGDVGDFCSHFAADQFGTVLAKELHAAGGNNALDGAAGMKKLYTNTFLKTNSMLKLSAIDDSLSGTTGITIIVKGERLFVGNVGDSRAIIATEIDGKLKYSALSSDQTPFRKDERERLKLKGARIFTIDQIDGHEPIHENWGNETGDEIDEASGDPPRVWDKTLEKPGCAFTRSIGDSVAESIGVFAEPEILTWDLQPQDKFAIIASDGVFEFLPNQAVVDMVAKFSDPIEAGKHVVAEAYRLWLQNDERTDDITVVILNFEMMRQRQGVAGSSISAPVPRKDQQTSELDQQARPVRKVMSKSRRKDISENFVNSAADDIEFDFAAHATPKTAAELERMSQMVKTNFMFQHLPAALRDKVFTAMTHRSVVEGEMVIREGDAGEEMYIIDEGEFSVLKKDTEGIAQLVFTYTSSGAAFGELSLMYGKPRAASIKAKTNGKLWVLGRQAFRAVLMKKNPPGLLNLFKGVPIFKTVELTKLHRLCEKCTVEEYKDGEMVAKLQPVLSLSGPNAASTGVDGTVSLLAPNSGGTGTAVENAAGGGGEGEGGDNTMKKTGAAGDKEKDAWIIGMVLQGSLRITNTDSSNGGGGGGGGTTLKSPRTYSREEGMYIVVHEIGASIASVVTEGRTKIAYIKKNDFLEMFGAKAAEELQQLVSAPKHRGKPLKRKNSFLSDPKLVECPRSSKPRSAYTCELTAMSVGDFAYIGTFNSKVLPAEATFSAKVIFKKKAEEARMDARLLLELRILRAAAAVSASNQSSNCLANINCTVQDERVILLTYDDVYVCDLGLAISQGVLKEDIKTYYCACLCSAVFTLHDLGVMHRFVNPGSVYINTRGICKLADLRYAKKLDGQKAYTICGDPMYFAPELVKQQGYDHGVDLWALGCVVFEMFEGSSPIGSADMEETQLFKKITSFDADAIEFTKASHKKVRSVVCDLLKTECFRRCGYKTHDDLKTKKIFAKVNWDTLGREKDMMYPIELMSHIEESSLPAELQLLPCTNENFENF